MFVSIFRFLIIYNLQRDRPDFSHGLQIIIPTNKTLSTQKLKIHILFVSFFQIFFINAQIIFCCSLYVTVTEHFLNIENIIDRAGAGDAYCGTFAAALHKDMSLRDAMCYASVAASLSCTKEGIQSSFASQTDIEEQLGNLELFSPEKYANSV